MKNKLYRGKYLIGIYELEQEGEACLGICENAKEFAKYMKISLESAIATLYKLFNKKTNYIKLNHKLRTVEFINMFE